MNKEQYMQQLIDQGYDKLTILRMVSEKFPEEEPKKQTDPVRPETSMGSRERSTHWEPRWQKKEARGKLKRSILKA